MPMSERVVVTRETRTKAASAGSEAGAACRSISFVAIDARPEKRAAVSLAPIA